MNRCGKEKSLPIAEAKVSSTSSSAANFPKIGFGKSHKKRCDRPFSLLDGISIRFLATPGCVNPPIVSLVDDITKLASPLTAIGPRGLLKIGRNTVQAGAEQ